MRPLSPTRGPDYVNTDLWWLHGLFSLLLVMALVAGVVLVVRMYLRRPNSWTPHPPARSPAIDQLDLRYARGEIDRADYLQRRLDLGDRSGPLPAPAQPPATPPSKGAAAG